MLLLLFISRYAISAFFIISLHETRARLFSVHSNKTFSSFGLNGFLPPPLNLLLCLPFWVTFFAWLSISLFFVRHSRILLSSTWNWREAGRLPCISAYVITSFLSSRLYLRIIFPLWEISSLFKASIFLVYYQSAAIISKPIICAGWNRHHFWRGNDPLWLAKASDTRAIFSLAPATQRVKFHYVALPSHFG